MPRLFGQKVRHLRQHQGLTQTDMARQLGLASQGHLSNLEQGRFAPSLDLVLAIARLLHVAVDYLLRDAIPVEQEAHMADEQRSTAHLAGQISALRRQAGLTQAAFATKLGLAGNAYISMLEAGRKAPAPDFLVQLADHLGVTVDTLLLPALPTTD